MISCRFMQKMIRNLLFDEPTKIKGAETKGKLFYDASKKTKGIVMYENINMRGGKAI